MDDMNRLFEQADAIADPAAQIGFLSNYYLDVVPASMPSDPFSKEYRDAAIEVYKHVCARDSYDQRSDEGMPDGALQVGVGQPQPFGISDSAWVGEGWIAWGFIMRALKLAKGQRVIEYGAGWGSMALALARNGCDVTVVDIEPGYLAWIEHQSRQVGTDITTLHGVFGDRPSAEDLYDAVVFLESFHHCLPHAQLLIDLQESTTPDGVVCLGDEPIFEPGNFWEPTVPFPWGPRLDLVSIRSGRRLGWMELGFREDYIVDAMLRAGWSVEKHECTLTRRGTCYIGRKVHDRLALSSTLLPAAYEATWHPVEALGRWSKGDSALVVPVSDRPRDIVVEIANYNVSPMAVTLTSGSGRVRAEIPSGQVIEVQSSIDAGERELRVESATFHPDEFLGNGDHRELGVFVREVRFV